MGYDGYKSLPTNGHLEVGAYLTPYGRVWVREESTELVYTSKDMGYIKTNFSTECECEGCEVFPYRATVAEVYTAFSKRNKQ